MSDADFDQLQEEFLVAKTRKENALALKYELDNAEAEGRLADVHVISAARDADNGVIRARLLAIPKKVAHLCEGMNAHDIESIILDEINESLRELSE